MVSQRNRNLEVYHPKRLRKSEKIGKSVKCFYERHLTIFENFVVCFSKRFRNNVEDVVLVSL